jgi:ribosomal protein S18 acetylase RimI-like enzyme
VVETSRRAGQTLKKSRKPTARLEPDNEPRIVVEASRNSATAVDLWKGLLRFNRQQVGPTRYKRSVLSVRDAKGRLLGGLILQSYWEESYIEVLWLSTRTRRAGIGKKLIEEAERHARRHGSRLIHLNTYSFQAPGFYEKQGYRRFGSLSGSPKDQSRHFYVKDLPAGKKATRA